MPDSIDNRAIEGAPMSWGDAFAALPPEPPPGDGWARVAGKLAARVAGPGAARREHRTSWLIGLASAAVLVVAAWSPLSQWLRVDGSGMQPSAAATAISGLRGPAAPAHAGQRIAAHSIEPGGIAAANAQAQTRPAAKHPSQPEGKAHAKRAHVAATATRPTASPLSRPDAASATVASAATDALHKLKSQSAQLEALVAMARDDNVGNAGNELLRSELDAGIEVVDAALSQQDLADDRRQQLWQQRVDLLRQLAGVEATARWLAAQGASSDTLLVSVD